ncbi:MULTISPECIES: TIGR02450 family Trp-rich protein [unclassified Neptuniibacter]|uniref:TIGR02450 family Trp-rich protein n=1 Tax=unclassified Neptuniibacter TaxID=2630693 RepID=UPI000C511AE7|nr:MULTISPECIES: TIGR02450 family Trp-rich protein [unclassified Neptuniibacter]MAY43306.1 TIGR02450 family Trp-rich protein [Oceanospirillaceae bacterium]
MNRINPKKLINSTWTAVSPVKKQKHFIVVALIRSEDDESKITGCVIEAVIDKQAYQIDWRDLKDTGYWLQGWK